MQLSVTDLLNYYRCQRLLFLNHFGDKSLQLSPTDFLKKLWKAGRNYESTVVKFFEYKKPKYKIGNYDKGLEETLKLMKEGVDTIYQGVLKIDDLQGIPDFLIKAEGNSLFGNYYYYPVDIKGASTSRERYIFQLACYSYMLGEIQGFTPLYGGLLLLNVDLHIRHFYSLIKDVAYAIDESKNILKDPDTMPDLFIDSNCQMCQWYDYCLPEANKRKHLSLVSGVNRNIKDKLERIEITSYEKLSKCSTNDMSSIEELDKNRSETITLQSKCLSENKTYLKSLPNLEEQKKEVFIDFESDMIFNDAGTELIRVDYLAGLLKSEGIGYEYSSLLLEDSEEIFVKKLSEFLNNHSDYTFYHYGHYEQTVLESKWTSLPKVNLVNLEKVVKDAVIMPVPSYSLKNIARYLGFKWKNKEANAMQSMCWYAEYLETKDRKFLDLSIQYNEDDCLALLFLKDWLISLKKKEEFVGKFLDGSASVLNPNA